MPFQILHLARDYNTRTSAGCQQPATLKSQDRGIFHLRPWSRMTFNEGSSIQVYSTYEYFHKRTPSLMRERDPEFMTKFDYSFHMLTSFTYIAIFPINQTFEKWSFLVKLPNLQHLQTQLTPSATNHVLDHPSALGTCQRSDLWTELKNAYLSLTEILTSGTYLQRSRLKELTILDHHNTGFRELFPNGWMEQELLNWHREGQGRYVREM
ncbi:hypothetical protein ACLMJK_001918 [Lecanora helva]